MLSAGGLKYLSGSYLEEFGRIVVPLIENLLFGSKNANCVVSIELI